MRPAFARFLHEYFGIEATNGPADGAPAPVTRIEQCWFCRSPLHGERVGVAPNDAALWYICDQCAIRSVTELVVRGRISVLDIIRSCEQELKRRRGDAEAQAQAITEPLDAIERRALDELAELRPQNGQRPTDDPNPTP